MYKGVSISVGELCGVMNDNQKGDPTLRVQRQEATGGETGGGGGGGAISPAPTFQHNTH